MAACRPSTCRPVRSWLRGRAAWSARSAPPRSRQRPAPRHCAVLCRHTGPIPPPPQEDTVLRRPQTLRCAAAKTLCCAGAPALCIGANIAQIAQFAIAHLVRCACLCVQQASRAEPFLVSRCPCCCCCVLAAVHLLPQGSALPHRAAPVRSAVAGDRDGPRRLHPRGAAGGRHRAVPARTPPETLRVVFCYSCVLLHSPLTPAGVF